MVNKMKKRVKSKKVDDIPKNIVVLVLMIAIIVSVTGTWMVLDTISNTEIPVFFQKAIVGKSNANVELNIVYDKPINQTNIPKEG
ncbi:hypothetical protein KY314_00390 [Candidatus Woesearchaeota archaeon]|nr:hypothetical protein [Candidatus Woesearchaeota archaeon]